MPKHSLLISVVAHVLLLCLSTLASSQTTSNSSDAKASTSASEVWHAGLWNVNSAKIIEDDMPQNPKHGHQELLLISGDIKIEIYLPNAEKRVGMKALGSKLIVTASDQEGILYVREESGTDDKKRIGRFTLAATNTEKTTATITYLHRRGNGKNWKYQLSISKIEDAEQLKSIATSMQRGLKDQGGGLMEMEMEVSKDSTHQAFMEKWANQVLHGSPGGRSALHNQSNSGTP